ncbi:MAG: heme exporter protein CcmB [Bacteroidota bacterium]
MSEVITLIKKDFILDWRQQNPFSSILLYLISTIFTAYLAFQGFMDTEVWNALFWIILLFIATSALSKSFFQEERRSHFYYFLTSPAKLLIAKMLYSFMYFLSLALLGLFLYSIFLGLPDMDAVLFATNLLLGCIGLSSVFTMVSAIAFRTSTKGVMMAVLGFPIVIPVLLLAIKTSFQILDGYILEQIQGNLISLFSLDIAIIALAFILFPFTWRA